MQTGAMFGSLAVVRAINARLSGDDELTALIDSDSIFHSTLAPQDVEGDFILFWVENADYTNTQQFSGHTSMQTVRALVSVRTDGADTDTIEAAAYRQMALLNGLNASVQTPYGTYAMTFEAQREVLPNTGEERGRFFSQIGTTYEVVVQYEED